MSGEVPRFYLDQIVKKGSTVSPQEIKLSLQRKKTQLFNTAKTIIEMHGDGDEGSRETDTLILGINENVRKSLQLVEDKTEPNGYVIKTEVWFPDEVGGGDRKELSISIKETEVKWGGKEASSEDLDTAMNLLIYLEDSDLSPALSPWEREQIKQDMTLGVGFMTRQREIERWRNDPYD
jgi:hypothetical protein